MKVHLQGPYGDAACGATLWGKEDGGYRKPAFAKDPEDVTCVTCQRNPHFRWYKVGWNACMEKIA